MLIVIEGLDGSGKSTQVRKLKQYLAQRCGNLNYIHFPRYDAPVYGDLISAFLRGDFGGNDEVHPQLVALLFAEDRHGAAPEIKARLERGETVLLDRYVYSNIAYQCAKLPTSNEREALREWILDTEYGQFALTRPDLNVFLDVPIDFVENNLTHSRRGADRNYLEGHQDIHEADIEFQKNVRGIYLRCCELDSSFIRVDCSDAGGRMLTPDETFARLRETVDKVL